MSERVIYLIHFEKPYKQARHYLGSTDNLLERIQRHRSGTGARLLQVLLVEGINWSVVRTWTGSHQIERWIKKRKNTPLLCPVCSGARAMKRCVNPTKKGNEW